MKKEETKIKEMIKELGYTFGILIAISTSIVSTITIKAIVFKSIWSLLIIKLFNVDSLSLIQCMSISVLIGFLTLKTSKINKEKLDTFADIFKNFGKTVGVYSMFLVTAYIISLFI
tara:strand:+ start:1568 stop:1915 length:348 start_codon:yes stop_codon:yes gene_type:complete